jgi:pimeloyl-ACP methyl ester carboxylesterase
VSGIDQVVELGGGRRATYGVIGEGRPLLYFTGGPGENAAILKEDARLLAGSFAVHLIEPPGSGGSSPPANPYGYDPTGHARFYEEVRSALGVERPLVMGFSFGASVALAYAGLFPEATAGCIAVAGRAVGAEAGLDSEDEMELALARHSGAQWYPAARATWDTWTERVLALESPEELDGMMLQVLPLYMADPESPGARAAIALWQSHLHSNLDAARAWEAGLWETLDIRALLGRIRCPTLVLAGELDLICGPTHGSLISELVEDSELITIPDCGHFIPAEQPERFLTAVLDFSARHPR